MAHHQIPTICLILLSVVHMATAKVCNLRVLVHGSSFNASLDGVYLETSVGIVFGYDSGELFKPDAIATNMEKDVALDDASTYFLRLRNAAKRPWNGGNIQVMTECGDILYSYRKTNQLLDEIRPMTFTCPTAPCHKCNYTAVIPVSDAPNTQAWYLYSQQNSVVAFKPGGTYTRELDTVEEAFEVGDGRTYTMALSGKWGKTPVKLLSQTNTVVATSSLADALVTVTTNGCKCISECMMVGMSRGTTYCQVAKGDPCTGTKDTKNARWDNCTVVPDGRFKLKGVEYIFFKQSMSWAHARDQCQLMGAELAVFHDAATMQAVWQRYFYSAGPFNSGSEPFVWIGTTRQGPYINVDGSPFDFSAFSSPKSICSVCPTTTPIGVILGGPVEAPTWVERPTTPLDPRMPMSKLRFPPICRRVAGLTFTAACPPPVAPAEPLQPTPYQELTEGDTTPASTATPGGLPFPNPLVAGLPGLDSSTLLLDPSRNGTKSTQSTAGTTSPGTIALIVFGLVGGTAILMVIVIGSWAYYRGLPFSEVMTHWRKGCANACCCACCHPSTRPAYLTKSIDLAHSLASRKPSSFSKFANEPLADSMPGEELKAVMIDTNVHQLSAPALVRPPSMTNKAKPRAQPPPPAANNWSPGIITADHIFNNPIHTTTPQKSPHRQHPLQNPFSSPAASTITLDTAPPQSPNQQRIFQVQLPPNSPGPIIRTIRAAVHTPSRTRILPSPTSPNNPSPSSTANQSLPSPSGHFTGPLSPNRRSGPFRFTQANYNVLPTASPAQPMQDPYTYTTNPAAPPPAARQLQPLISPRSSPLRSHRPQAISVPSPPGEATEPASGASSFTEWRQQAQ